MTNQGLRGFPSTADVVPDGSITASKLAAPTAFGRLVSGSYYFCSGSLVTSTNNGLGVGTLRVFPWFIPNTVSISSIGAEIQTTGDSGSKLRLGIYADNGTCYPGKLVLDAGQIAGDSAAVQEIAVSQYLPAGLYWVGGVVQSVTTTQPTVRTAANAFLLSANFQLPSVPTANQTVGGYSHGSVTAALPAVFSSTVSSAGTQGARTFVKVA